MELMNRKKAISLLEICTSNPTEEEIKRSYKKMARKYHPDLHMGESEEKQAFYNEKFQELTLAYNVLMGKEDEWAGGKVDIPSYEEILKSGALGEFVIDPKDIEYKPKGKTQIEVVNNLVKEIKETRGK